MACANIKETMTNKVDDICIKFARCEFAFFSLWVWQGGISTQENGHYFDYVGHYNQAKSIAWNFSKGSKKCLVDSLETSRESDLNSVVCNQTLRIVKCMWNTKFASDKNDALDSGCWSLLNAIYVKRST